MSLVRRRRWVRVKTCIDVATKAGFKELVSFNDYLRLRLGMLSEKKTDEFRAYQDHFHKRADQVLVTMRYAQEAADENISILSHIVRKLNFVKEFLEERGTIEAAHAQALEALSEKWRDCGGLPEDVASEIDGARVRIVEGMTHRNQAFSCVLPLLTHWLPLVWSLSPFCSRSPYLLTWMPCLTRPTCCCTTVSLRT